MAVDRANDDSDAAERAADDVDIRRVIVGGGLIAVAIVVALLSAWAASSRSVSERVVEPIERADRPALQSDPVADLERYRAEQNARRDEYRWIDKRAGVVRIPVERAIDLTVAEHANAAKPAPAERR